MILDKNSHHIYHTKTPLRYPSETSQYKQATPHHSSHYAHAEQQDSLQRVTPQSERQPGDQPVEQGPSLKT